VTRAATWRAASRLHGRRGGFADVGQPVEDGAHAACSARTPLWLEQCPAAGVFAVDLPGLLPARSPFWPLDPLLDGCEGFFVLIVRRVARCPKNCTPPCTIRRRSRRRLPESLPRAHRERLPQRLCTAS
jgi:hypothetical protein